MSRRRAHLHFFPGSLGACLLGLCLLCARVPALAAPTAPAAAAFGLTVEACGRLIPRPEGTAGQHPVRLASSGLVLEPGDRGLGCRFVVTGEPRGEAVLVEVRLTRPALVGGGQAVDRWYVPARRGEAALAEHLFAASGEAAPGQWDLALYLDDRLQAERRFEIRGADPVPAPASVAAAAPAPAPPAATEASRSEAALSPQETTAADMAIMLAPESTSGVVPEAWAAVLPRSTPDAGKTPSPVPGNNPPTPPVKSAPARPAGQNPVKPVQAQPKPAPMPRTSAPAPATGAASQPVAATGYFALQTGVFSHPDNAATQAARLRGRGVPACVATESGAGGTRYRVLAGRYGDRRAALASRDEVAAAVGGGAVLFRVDPPVASRLRCH